MGLFWICSITGYFEIMKCDPEFNLIFLLNKSSELILSRVSIFLQVETDSQNVSKAFIWIEYRTVIVKVFPESDKTISWNKTSLETHHIISVHSGQVLGLIWTKLKETIFWKIVSRSWPRVHCPGQNGRDKSLISFNCRMPCKIVSFVSDK